MTNPKTAVCAEISCIVSEKDLEDIYCEAVNYEKFRTDLDNMPHERFSDLAVIYYVEKTAEGRIRTKPLTFESVRKLGMTEDDLRETAWKNTLLKKKAVMMPLSDLLGCDCGDDAVSLFVLSNENMYLGAVTILYPELLDLIAERFERDLYIIPSSIHECLIVPENESITGKELRSLVKKVNDTEVAENEILSYNVYKYSRTKGVITIDNGQNAMLS